MAQSSGRPSSVSLRRATSSAYYALFHALARGSADLLIGSSRPRRSQPAWNQVYRSLNHATAMKACRNSGLLQKFPQPIIDVGLAFVSLQQSRHRADYDPDARFTKADVRQAIELARQAMANFSEADAKDRRAFCAYVLLGQPRG